MAKEKVKLVLYEFDKYKLRDLAAQLDTQEEVSVKVDYLTMLKEVLL